MSSSSLCSTIHGGGPGEAIAHHGLRTRNHKEGLQELHVSMAELQGSIVDTTKSTVDTTNAKSSCGNVLKGYIIHINAFLSAILEMPSGAQLAHTAVSLLSSPANRSRSPQISYRTTFNYLIHGCQMLLMLLIR